LVSFGFDFVSEVSARVVPVEQALVYCPGLAKGLGRAVAAETLKSSDFSGFGRGKSEHYRAASPLTAGRLKISELSFPRGILSSEIFKRRQVQQKIFQPRGFEISFEISNLKRGVMGEMVRPARA